MRTRHRCPHCGATFQGGEPIPNRGDLPPWFWPVLAWAGWLAFLANL